MPYPRPTPYDAIVIGCGQSQAPWVCVRPMPVGITLPGSDAAEGAHRIVLAMRMALKAEQLEDLLAIHPTSSPCVPSLIDILQSLESLQSSVPSENA